VTGVIESNSINEPPSCAETLTLPAPTRLNAPTVATRNLRQPLIEMPP